MYRFAATLAVAIAMLSVAAAPGNAKNPQRPAGPSAILVLIPQAPGQSPGFDDGINRGFAAMSPLSVGLVSATQGSYEASQALLDISQGTRVSRSTYDPEDVPPNALLAFDGSARLGGWPAIRRRADSAPQTIVPGLLASSVPGGSGYLGNHRPSRDTAIPAANEHGWIPSYSIGKPARIATRAETMAHRRPFVVVRTSPGRQGLSQLGNLLELRPANQLVIAMQSPPVAMDLPLLPIGIAGLDGGTAGLRSPTTNQPNLVAGIDIGPTVLDHLNLAIPGDMRGQPITAEGERDPGSLKPLRDRLASIGSRRMPGLGLLFAGWLGIFLLAGALVGRDRARGPVRRLGGLAVLWIPTVILIPAAIGNPPALIEYLIIAGSALLLGRLTDRLLPWPRAPLIPAVVGLGVITFDLAFNTHLIIQSILGPNPGYGSRFYGVGNELKSGLTVLMLAGVAAWLTGRPKSNRSALIIVACGLALGVVLGSGRLGAGVGAVIIVASATAVAALMMAPGGLTRRRLGILIAAPVIGLLVLAGLDLLTAGGQGHFTHNVLDLTSWNTASDIVTRRSTLAWQQLEKGSMPIVVALCLLAAFFTIRNRDMFEPFAGPVWPAALTGGLVGGLIGSVSEDSGPLLIVVATITLAGVCSYLLGRPEKTGPAAPSPEPQRPAPHQARPQADPACPPHSRK